MIQYLPSRFVVKEHKPMISGRLCMNCFLKHLLYAHSLVNRHPIPDTTPAADWKQRRCCLQAPADLCHDWLFYRMCCWVNAGMDCMCLMKIAKTPGRISQSVHLSAWECCSTLQHSHALKWTDPGLSSCSDCLVKPPVHRSPLLAAELALMCGTACLLPEVTSARPSLATFRTRVKTFLFMESYPDIRLIWHVVSTQCLIMTLVF